jgi:ribokinase
VARHAQIYSGGSAANTALVLARCGVEVGLIARVGRDALAAQTLVELSEAGVDGRQIQYDPELTSGIMFVAVTPDGERTMLGYRGANVRLDPALIAGEEISRARVLHVSGYALLESPQRDAALKAIEIARRSGVRVSLDLGVEAAQNQAERIHTLLPGVSWIFPNQMEAESLVGHVDGSRAVRRFLDYGLEAVVLKLGEMGCVIGSEDGVFAVPAFDVEVRDTTGAGDSFDAGFIAARLNGLSWRASGLLANALGGLAAAVMGAGESLPRLEAVRRLLEEQGSRKLWQRWQDEIRAVQALIASTMLAEQSRDKTANPWYQSLAPSDGRQRGDSDDG